MASNFEQPCLNWGAKDMYQEYQRFKQHVEFTFKGPLASTDKKHKAGWLGMWIGQQGREIYKTFTFTVPADDAEAEEDDPAVVLKKFEDYVRPRQNKRVSRFRAHQRKQLEGCDKLGDDFIEFRDFYISKTNVEVINSVSLSDCFILCTNRTEYSCLSVEYGRSTNKCYLANATYLEWPDRWYYDGDGAFNISYYERDCV